MKICAIQMRAGHDVQVNLAVAEKLILEAVDEQALFIVLPEVFQFRGKLNNDSKLTLYENIPGPTTQRFQRIAEQFKVDIVLGSIYEKSPEPGRAYNTSVHIGGDGVIKAIYRKIHLFKATLGDKTICEADHFMSGDQPVKSMVNQVPIGLSICYDLRFPSLYHYYRQQAVNILLVPAAFTYQTGKDHWRVLNQARAIENTSYVIAPNQYGYDERGIQCYGHSMIIDPWGEVLAEASADQDEIILADYDEEKLKNVRNVLPFNHSCIKNL